MMTNIDNATGAAFDANSLNSLKQAAKENSPEAIKGVAKQFEAIFMNMMLKSMRDATPQDNPFDNEQSRTFTSMLDQQLSNNLATRGLGLADILAKQLSKTAYMDNANTVKALKSDVQENNGDAAFNNIKAEITSFNENPLLESAKNTFQNAALDDTLSVALKNNPLSDQTKHFQQRMSGYAEEASRATGIPAHLMLGQAALESGWGKREIKANDGTASNNLFGIKATAGWDGKVVETTTTEYVNGIKQKRIEKFRAYDSYAESFKDFANMMRNNPRYENVMANTQNISAYAQAMQNAGYATDPNYASKLASVIRKVAASST